MLIVAHRGGNPDDVENSASSFRHGIDSGADLLECDLQQSASGDIVVYHDTNYFGVSISDFSTNELRALIPTLLTFEELLALVDDAAPESRLVLDLKSRDVDRALVAYLESSDLRRRALVTGDYGWSLHRLQRHLPGLRTGLSRGPAVVRLPERWRPLAARVLRRLVVFRTIVEMKLFGIQTAALNHHLIDRWTIEQFHDRGLRVYAWTVDAPERAERLRRLGVDYLTTNDPAGLARSLRALQD